MFQQTHGDTNGFRPVGSAAAKQSSMNLQK